MRSKRWPEGFGRGISKREKNSSDALDRSARVRRGRALRADPLVNHDTNDDPRHAVHEPAPSVMNAVEYCLLHGLKLAAPEHPAILCAQESLSYGALATRVSQFAAGLRETGVRPSDRVGMLMLDTPDLIALHLGAIAPGAIAVATSNQWLHLLAQRTDPLVPVVNGRILATHRRRAFVSGHQRPGGRGYDFGVLELSRRDRLTLAGRIGRII
jgi:hypothetical protein